MKRYFTIVLLCSCMSQLSSVYQNKIQSNENGSEVNELESSGRFSGSNESALSETEIGCIVPDHSSLVSVTPDVDHVGLNKTITYKCKSGYQIAGRNNFSLAATCVSNRTWSIGVPHCIVIVTNVYVYNCYENGTFVTPAYCSNFNEEVICSNQFGCTLKLTSLYGSQSFWNISTIFCRCNKDFPWQLTTPETISVKPSTDYCNSMNPCHAHAQCNNTKLGYQCTCKPGFIGNGKLCKDIDECAEISSHKCHENASCSNSVGSYNCSCNKGFDGNGIDCFAYLEHEPCSRNNNLKTNLSSCSDYISQITLNLNSTETVEEAVLQVEEIISDVSNITEAEVQQVINFISNVTKLLEAGRIKVSAATFHSVALITSHLGQGYFVSTMNQQNNLLVDRKFKQDLVQSVSVMALRIELDAANPTFNFNNSFFAIMASVYPENESTSISFTSPNNAVRVKIPESATRRAWQDIIRKRKKRDESSSNRRSAFIFYSNDAFFYSENNVSSVVSVEIGLNGSLNGLSEPVRIQYSNELARYGVTLADNSTLKMLKTTLKCVAWNFDTKEWITEGCCLNINSELPECLCNHLTNFALIVKSENVPANVVLGVVSDIGCSLSVAGLVITILFHLSNAELRVRRATKIFLQICINLSLCYIIFLTGISQTKNEPVCVFVTFLLHYFFLVTWAWMSVYSYDMYLCLVKVFHQNHSYFLRKVGGIAYAVPALIAGTTLALGLGYSTHQSSNLLCGQVSDPLATSPYRVDNICWLKGHYLYFGFLLPVALMLVYNFVVFILVFREINGNSKIKSSAVRYNNIQRFLIAITMACFMGFTWVFGYLLLISEDALYITVMSWLFALLNSLQGFAIFILTVRRKEIRGPWWQSIRKSTSHVSSNILYKMSLSKQKSNMTTISDAITATQSDRPPTEYVSEDSFGQHVEKMEEDNHILQTNVVIVHQAKLFSDFSQNVVEVMPQKIEKDESAETAE